MDADVKAGWLKVALAWIGLVVGGITLGQIAAVLTIAFTVFQLYVGIRKLRKEIRMEMLEAKLKHEDAQ